MNESHYRADSIKARFFEAYFSGMNLEEIVKLASGLLNNPIILYDSNHRILAHAQAESITDPYWSKYVEQGYCDYEYIAKISARPDVIQARRATGTSRVYCEMYNNSKAVCAIRMDGISIASVLMLECISEITETDCSLLADLACMIRKIIKRTSYHTSATILKEDIFYDLLEKHMGSEEELAARLDIAGLKLPAEMQLLLFDVSESPDRDIHRQSYDIREVLYGRIGCYAAIGYKEYIVAICTEDNFATHKAELDKYCKDNSFVLGVSRVIDNPFNLRPVYLRAISAIRIGRKVYPHSRIHQEYQTALFALLPDLPTQQAYESYCNPKLKKLKAYDERHSAELYITLRTYLLCKENVQQAAASLYIHRNTLRYRLAKAIEVSGIDMEDAIQISDIMNSYRAMQYYQIDELPPDQPAAEDTKLRQI